MNLPVKTSGTSALMDPDTFAQMQRVGNMLAMSPLFPDHLRQGQEGTAVANGTLVMNMALRLNEDPLTVAQNIYFVSGKPGWSSSYMISKANQFGVFKNPIDWEITGEGDSLSVTAFAELASTGRRVEVTCDMALAKGEGWTKNKKYQTMPEQMLRYRSATFLIRLYCPEVMVGVPALIEVETGGDMRDITPPAQRTQAKAAEKPKAELDKKPAAREKDAPKTEAKLEPEPETKAETVEHEAAIEQEQADEDLSPTEQIFENISADLLQCQGDTETVKTLYAEQFETLKLEAPNLYRQLMEHIEQIGKES